MNILAITLGLFLLPSFAGQDLSYQISAIGVFGATDMTGIPNSVQIRQKTRDLYPVSLVPKIDSNGNVIISDVLEFEVDRVVTFKQNWGDPRWITGAKSRLLGLRFRLDPTGFFQIENDRRETLGHGSYVVEGSTVTLITTTLRTQYIVFMDFGREPIVAHIAVTASNWTGQRHSYEANLVLKTK